VGKLKKSGRVGGKKWKWSCKKYVQTQEIANKT
jgi:hypothetical protein